MPDDRIAVLERALALYAEPDDSNHWVSHTQFDPPWLPAMMVLNPDGQFAVETLISRKRYALTFNGVRIEYGSMADIEEKQREIQALIDRLRGPDGGEGA